MLIFGPALFGLALLAVNLIAFAAAPPEAAPQHRCAAGCFIVASPSPGQVGNHLAAVTSFSVSDAWAVGGASTPIGNPPILVSTPLIAHWDGLAWRSVNTPALIDGGALAATAGISPKDIWAVGHQGPPDGGTPLVEHWNGSSWAVVPSPMVSQGFLLGVSALRADDMWAVGLRLGTTTRSLIEHWNGSSWKVMKSPNPNADYNEIDSVVSVSPTDAWAVGFTFSPSTGSSQALIARWNGSQWASVPSLMTGLPNNILRSVAATTGREVWAVGQSSSADGSTIQPLVERWSDRGGWSVVSSPSSTPQSRLTGVAAVGDVIWVVGVQAIGFTNQTLIARAVKGKFSVVPSKNRGTGANGLEGVGAAGNGAVWTVGSDQGQTKGVSLVLHACAA